MEKKLTAAAGADSTAALAVGFLDFGLLDCWQVTEPIKVTMTKHINN